MRGSRLIILISLIGIVLLVIIASVSRGGDPKLTIEVIPKDSSLYINGKRLKDTSVRLKSGTYEVTAKHQGYDDDTQTVTVKNDNVEVSLIPDPVSEAAIKYISDNPELSRRREEVGGQRARSTGEAYIKKRPIIELLPYTDVNGPFTINYGPSQLHKGDVFLAIDDSSPRGRENALRWIRQQGYDPTDFEIYFRDYLSPLPKTVPEGQDE